MVDNSSDSTSTDKSTTAEKKKTKSKGLKRNYANDYDPYWSDSVVYDTVTGRVNDLPNINIYISHQIMSTETEGVKLDEGNVLGKSTIGGSSNNNTDNNNTNTDNTNTENSST